MRLCRCLGRDYAGHRVASRIFGKRADVVHLPRAREASTRFTPPEAFDLALCDLRMLEKPLDRARLLSLLPAA